MKTRRMERRNELTDQALISQVHSLQPTPTLLTFQFENVYAGGLRSKNELNARDRDNLEKMDNCRYYQLERGGQVTWHGQGQLVSYLIMDLKAYENLSTKCYVSNVLLKSAQNVLKKGYGIDSIQTENPGVWINDDAKIGSVGIRVRHGITDFGISLNVNPDLKYMNTFEMCGLKEKKATSIYEQIGATPKIQEVADLYAKEIGEALEVDKVVSTTPNHF
ncbi:LIPB Octanoyltransferase [Candida maltosa Xu316]|uniref:Octanoyltransferase n=1 Tax=Candida maltosa (strain Xu316) TaxID=1245528 RepID=M3HHU1_CANMX|nr:hypothetical protein G210_2854 [Candida maltosa Xu316]